MDEPISCILLINDGHDDVRVRARDGRVRHGVCTKELNYNMTEIYHVKGTLHDGHRSQIHVRVRDRHAHGKMEDDLYQVFISAPFQHVTSVNVDMYKP